MTDASGAKCPRCGVWNQAGSLRCICGFDAAAPGREAIASIGSALFMGAVVAVDWWMTTLYYVGAFPLVFCGAPLTLAAVVVGVYGARRGAVAVRGRGSARVLGAMGLLACVSFLVAPVALFVAERLAGR